MTKATLLDTREDAINLNLGLPMGFHIPFGSLRYYYEGGIHRPLTTVGDLSQTELCGHELYPNTGMFLPPDLKPGDVPEDYFKDSWLKDGVWLGDKHYDARDVPGGHMRVDQGQEMIFTTVESVNGERAFANAIRNFTEMTDFLPPMIGQHTVARVHAWRDKIDHNLPFMELSWGDAPVNPTLVYVGSGPSLSRNCDELLKLDYSRATVCAANEAFGYLLRRGIPVDYAFCMDATSPERWWSDVDCSETCLVTTSFVTPAILKANWKRVYWFNIKGDGFYYNKVRQARPNLLEIDATMGIGSTIIESAWPHKCRRVIMAGCDFCYEINQDTKEIRRSVGVTIKEEEWRRLSTSHAHYIVLNHRNQSVPTFFGLAFEAAAVFGAAQCLWEKGVEVINATEGGILRPNPSCRYLQKHIAKIGRPIMACKTLKEAVALANAP